MSEKEIAKGVTLGGSLRHRPELFPRMFVSLVSVGEKTGTVENVFDSIADFYEEEVDESLKALVSVLEPLLLIIMGFVVGSIAISIILPIYGLVSNI
ncbi:type II secretion system F family protein [Candidatus Azambacteria bacterium]|nr:type II secretion system F family protein [Candidatus Azambacteria bacterium]